LTCFYSTVALVIPISIAASIEWYNVS